MNKYIRDNELNNFTKDYNEYELLKKYYVVWLLTSEKRWYQEVDEPHFNLAKKELWKNNKNPNCIPYLLYIEYFVKNDYISTPVLVEKTIYDDIEKAQNRFRNREFYISKRYKCREKDFEIENIAISKLITEEKVIHNIFEENILNFIKNDLSITQFNIFYCLFFKDMTQAETARELKVSKQSINENVMYIRKKIKKFFN